MFKTLDEACAAYEALNEKFESLQGDHTAAQALAEETEKAKTEAEAALVTSKEAQTKAEEKLQKETERATKLEADLKTAQKENDTLKAEAKSAEERAAAMCAAAGVDPISIDPDNKSEGSLTEQYQAITDPVEKANFLEKHKAALVKESNSKK